MADVHKQVSQSLMNNAFTLAAVDACSLLRKWSDIDGKIDPSRIGEFQEQLIEHFAAMYFGAVLSDIALLFSPYL